MRYSSAGSFRRALEDQLKKYHLTSHRPLDRLRKMVAFERLLARLAAHQPDAWVLKGGFALQLRIGDKSRTTKDIDLLLRIRPEESHAFLRNAGSLELGDWFQFEVATPHEDMEGDQKRILRFPVKALLDGRIFEEFHVDVGFDDPIFEPIEKLEAPGYLLDFAEIPPAVVPCYPLTQQIAEKVHAYTKPHPSGEPSRVRDIIDILLIAELGKINSSYLLQALQSTFEAKGTHPLPNRLPDPPSSWASPFRKLARELDLNWGSIDEAKDAASRFLNPMLHMRVKGIWDPNSWAWKKK
ncbi:MAG TPA: nucleotidyl transferase AbiEii/AbiGii toxin family protein [Anaerolineae bacterium]|nr:nucleotidyl transferase AbiEii/AbiGii toxin family protein [Anaerolineae bacterium]